MRKLFAFFVVFIVIFISGYELSYAQTSSKAETITSSLSEIAGCRCFCSDKKGAEDLGNYPIELGCQEGCKVEGKKFLGCYTNELDWPKNNDLCWTKSACESIESQTTTGETQAGDWGGQRPECMSGQGYCYNPVEPITLGVAIPNLITASNNISSTGASAKKGSNVVVNFGENQTQTVGFAQYVALVYAWLIPAATILAIVMIMIGGLQYMLAGGDQGKVGKAKERMGNAVAGLVLLLSAWLIAHTIDPSLTSFQELRLPKVKTVVFLDPNTSCEVLGAQGVKVEPIKPIEENEAKRLCGYKGRVKSGSDQVSIIGFREGDTCDYQSCDTIGAKCTRLKTGTDEYENRCIRCASLYDTSGGTSSSIPNMALSDQNCKNLQYDPASNPDIPIGDEIFSCEFLNVKALTANFSSYDACAEIVYPTEKSLSIDCETLRQEEGASCRSYDKLLVIRGLDENGEQTILDSIDTPKLDAFAGADNSFPLLLKICNEDPCNLGPNNGIGSCTVFTGGKYSIFAEYCQNGAWLAQTPICDVLSVVNKADCVDMETYNQLEGYLDSFQQLKDSVSVTGILGQIINLDFTTGDAAVEFERRVSQKTASVDARGNSYNYFDTLLQ